MPTGLMARSDSGGTLSDSASQEPLQALTLSVFHPCLSSDRVFIGGHQILL